MLASHASQALATLAAGEEELHALAGLEAGTIHIGASTTPGVYLLPDTLGCFRRDHPNVTVEVEIASTGEIIERLLAGRVQLALVGETEADERIELEPFLSDEIVGIAKPGLLRNARRARSKPEALAAQTLLVREARSSTRQVTDRALRAAGVEPEARLGTRLSEAIKRAAREGLGIAFLSRYAVAEEIERGELESFRLAGQPTDRAATSTSPASRDARPARANAASSRPSPAAAPRAPTTRPRSSARRMAPVLDPEGAHLHRCAGSASSKTCPSSRWAAARGD